MDGTWLFAERRHYSWGENRVKAESALDFIWPSLKRGFGWYFEPGYQYNFGRRHERSIGGKRGLPIAIP